MARPGKAFVARRRPASSQRTWLEGAKTGRIALLLDFAFGAAVFDPTICVGSSFQASLSFHPGTTLRSTIISKGADLGPFETIAGDSSIRSAWVKAQRALVRNPWLADAPMALAGVTLAARGDSWFLNDSEGAELPIWRGFETGWRVLGLSGGRPMFAFGEWDSRTFKPMLMLYERAKMIVHSSEDPPGPQAFVEPSGAADLERAWKELWSVALAGTMRKPLNASWNGLLAPFVSKIRDLPPEESVLAAGAFLLSSARGGCEPLMPKEPLPPPAAPDLMAECPRPAAMRLRSMLSGEFAEIVGEWLELASRGGYRIPGSCLAELFDIGIKHKPLRSRIVELRDERGRWLAGFSPTWEVLYAPRPDQLERIWEEDAKPERKEALASLRALDPERGRRVLESTWSQETAADRAEFLEILIETVGPDDEAFLESALDDRGGAVRRMAASLLTRIDGSRLRARMRQRAITYVGWNTGRLTVDPPIACDKSMQRDGLEAKPPAKVSVSPEGWLLRQVVASSPLETWASLGATPLQWLKSARAERSWRLDLWLGWASAASKGPCEPEWIEALLRDRPDAPDEIEQLVGDLLGRLEQPRRDRLVVELVGTTRDPFRSRVCFQMIRSVRGNIGLELGRMMIFWLRDFLEAQAAAPALALANNWPMHWLGARETSAGRSLRRVHGRRCRVHDRPQVVVCARDR